MFYIIISLMIAGCGRETVPQEETKDSLFLGAQRCLSENRGDEAFKLLVGCVRNGRIIVPKHILNWGSFI